VTWLQRRQDSSDDNQTPMTTQDSQQRQQDSQRRQQDSQRQQQDSQRRQQDSQRRQQDSQRIWQESHNDTSNRNEIKWQFQQVILNLFMSMTCSSESHFLHVTSYCIWCYSMSCGSAWYMQIHVMVHVVVLHILSCCWMSCFYCMLSSDTACDTAYPYAYIICPFRTLCVFASTWWHFIAFQVLLLNVSCVSAW